MCKKMVGEDATDEPRFLFEVQKGGPDSLQDGNYKAIDSCQITEQGGAVYRCGCR